MDDISNFKYFMKQTYIFLLGMLMIFLSLAVAASPGIAALLIMTFTKNPGWLYLLFLLIFTLPLGMWLCIITVKFLVIYMGDEW